MLLTLTRALFKNQNERSLQLGDRATTIFLEIICQRQDRLKVKPALQGLAHFLRKDVISLSKLIELYQQLLRKNKEDSTASYAIEREIFQSFLSWVVHHDTSLSAGHLIKNFLASHRGTLSIDAGEPSARLPIWIVPVIEMLHKWQDRIQEFKTHVFPYCFLPNIQEYLSFLSYLHFSQHIHTKHPLPETLTDEYGSSNALNSLEEFKFLLAAIQTGKELGLIKDLGETESR